MYETIINEEYNKIGFKPIHDQVKIIDEILVSFMDGGYQNVVLNASPGAGKSLIGYIINRCISRIEGINDKQAFILVHNNSLVKQYRNSFDDISFITGAGNYRCSITGEMADNCIQSHLFKKVNKTDIDKNNLAYCKHQCKFKKSRQHANDNTLLLTNYSYFIINRLNSEFLEERNLTIYDEAHTLNDVFVNHMSIDISKDKLQTMIDDLSNLKLESVKNDIKYVLDDINGDYINKSNYLDYLAIVMDSETKLVSKLNFLMKGEDDVEEFKHYNKLVGRYSNECNKIEDFIKNTYEHNIDINEEGFTIKPIFIDDKIGKICHSKYNLFMSATIEKKVFEKTISLENVKYINADPVFPKENKKVMFFNIGSINYSFLQQNKNKNIIVDYVKDIIEAHNEENGMIHTPSFIMNKYIGERLKRMEKKLNVKVFVHKQGEKFDYLFKRFKRYNEGPKVMLSPSAYEGIDLKDDLARYQVIVKAPYPSLSDSRIKYILNNHNELYKMITLYKVIQGMGRSTRSPEDYSTVYCLDSNLEKLFKDSDNIWRDEFEIIE